MTEPDIMTNPLVKVNAVRFNSSLERNHKSILLELIFSVDNATNQRNISLSEFEKRTGMSRPTVIKTLKELKDSGIITILEVGNNLTNKSSKYKLLPEKLKDEVNWKELRNR